MLQRVAIAQALLNDPELLLLDEPTSGLDPIGIKEIREILLEIQDKGTTIFLNSHFLSEIERTCDRVAILHKGKIIRSGSRADLSAKTKHLEVVGEGFTEKMAQEIHAISARKIEKEGRLMRVYLNKEEDTITVHQIIVKNGGKLVSLAWKGESLEDVFYRLVKEEEM
jgi:ABC-2 type transport system ATP-binding protein